MKSFNKLFKYGLLLAPVGGFTYLNNASHPAAAQPINNLSNHQSSSYFKQYVEQNNLISPSLYKKYQAKYKFNHFFEKGLLKDLEGLDIYNLFLNKDYHNSLTNDRKVSQDNKQEVHEQAKMHCTFTANEKLQSASGNIHGGFTSTLFDNVAGCLAFMASDFSPAVTAYLNIRHEQPMKVGTDYVAVVEVDRIEGRKVYLKGKIVDKENNVYTNMESLFVRPKWGGYLKHVYRYFLNDKKEEQLEMAC